MPTKAENCKVKKLEVTTQPVEQLLSMAELAQVFIQIADNGKLLFEFVDPDWARLAVKIVALVKENTRLKAILGGKTVDHKLVPDVHANYDQLKLQFGPEGKYELIVPVLENQEELAERLQTVANELLKQRKQKEENLTLF